MILTKHYQLIKYIKRSGQSFHLSSLADPSAMYSHCVYVAYMVYIYIYKYTYIYINSIYT